MPGVVYFNPVFVGVLYENLVDAVRPVADVSYPFGTAVIGDGEFVEQGDERGEGGDGKAVMQHEREGYCVFQTFHQVQGDVIADVKPLIF